MKVRAKKYLGQHFLKDENITQKIAEAIYSLDSKTLVEIGPGMGMLTKYLIGKHPDFKVVEVDKESVIYLEKHYPELNIVEGDFLKLDSSLLIGEQTSIVGNFPYNISSQIFFKVLENRDKVDSVVCMIQKEVAQRMSEKEGNKTYGILSVLVQTFYDVEYLFTVNENVFVPPPKVKSAVIKLIRNQREKLPCNEKLFIRLVKESFNQRRKMIRSSIRQHVQHIKEHRFLSMRPEQLSIDDFIELTLLVENKVVS